MISRRGVLAAGAGLPFLAQAGAALADIPGYPIGRFYERPFGRDAALSPDGRRIAVLYRTREGETDSYFVTIADAADPVASARPLNLGESKGDRFQLFGIEWGNADRLLVWAGIRQTVDLGGPALGTRVGGRRREDVTAVRTISVSVSGKGPPSVLFSNMRDSFRYTTNTGSLVSTLPKDDDHVLMVNVDTRDGVLTLYKVDVTTGVAEVQERGGGRTTRFYVDADGRPVLRFDANLRGTAYDVLARAPGETAWKSIRRVNVLVDYEYNIVGAGERPGTMLVAARQGEEDFRTLREFDLASGAYGPALLTLPDSDVEDAVFDTDGRLAAATYTTDRRAYAFADKGWAPHLRAIDKLLEGECNLLVSSLHAPTSRMILRARGPREPGLILFYDRNGARLETLASARHDLDPPKLSKGSAFTVKCRDGATIQAFLHAPPGGKPGPLVVMPHGGPEARDSLDWDRWVQILGAQGWWVLQPQFRGSAGYGRAFTRAGHGRWGDLMQWDVEDAVEQTLATAGLDRSRIAIMGASYGGYAALMGSVLRPDLYKAVISICGVSDLPQILADEKRDDDTQGEVVYGLWRERIGDPQVDAERLVRASPARRAAEIKAPVLLYHGKEDRIVYPNQSRLMAAALQRAGKSVQHVEVDDVGHPYWPNEDDQALMEGCVAFIKRAFG